MTETVGRFAPSPTGRMHLGNVFSALLSWLSAKSGALCPTEGRGTTKDGSWLLRIEDIDPQRSKQQWADLIMEDLEWLGLTWDQGPYYQSQRSDIYEHYLNQLKAQGLIYPSYKTRAERLAVSAPQSTGQTIESSMPSIASMSSIASMPRQANKDSLRGADTLKVGDETIYYVDGHYGLQSIDMRRDIGDFIVRRRDGAWAYQLAVVVDDALMGVTEVVRGRDLLQSAGQQIYLRRLLGFEPLATALPTELCEEPPEPLNLRFAHLPLLCNEAGQRLSKRDKSLDLGVLREKFSAEEIIGRLAYYAHLIPEYEPITPEQLIGTFSWEKVPTENILITVPRGTGISVAPAAV